MKKAFEFGSAGPIVGIIDVAYKPIPDAVFEADGRIAHKGEVTNITIYYKDSPVQARIIDLPAHAIIALAEKLKQLNNAIELMEPD